MEIHQYWTVPRQTQTDTEDDHPILRREVEAAVQSLKKGKSVGVDNIPAELVQAGGEDVITVIQEYGRVACFWTLLAVQIWMIWPWLLHPGSRWIPNVLISSGIWSQWRTILGHPQLIECMGICVLSLAHAWLWTKGFRYYLHIVKKNHLDYFKVQPGHVPLDGLCLDFFLGIFYFLRGSVGQIIYREYVVFRGSDISCSLVCGRSYSKGRQVAWEE